MARGKPRTSAETIARRKQASKKNKKTYKQCLPEIKVNIIVNENNVNKMKNVESNDSDKENITKKFGDFFKATPGRERKHN